MSVSLRHALRLVFFFFSSRRRHTRFDCDWSSDVCSSDLIPGIQIEFPESIKPSAGYIAEMERRRTRPPYSVTMQRDLVIKEDIRIFEIGRASCRERV